MGAVRAWAPCSVWPALCRGAHVLAAREVVLRSLSPLSDAPSVANPIIRVPEDRHVPTPDFGSTRSSDELDVCTSSFCRACRSGCVTCRPLPRVGTCGTQVRRSLADTLASLSAGSPAVEQAIFQVDEKMKLLAQTQQLQANEIRDLRLSLIRTFAAVSAGAPWP